MTYSISVDHIDTCFPDYVLDHCNGDDELLIGIPVDRSTRMWQLRRELESEVGAYDDIPEDIEDSAINAAIVAAFNGSHPLACFDSSLEPGFPGDDMPQAWFRFTWWQDAESEDD